MGAPKLCWLDTNVLIGAKNGAYSFDLFPRFWVELEKLIIGGSVRVPQSVYKEIVQDEPKDKLAEWMKIRRGNGLCVKPDGEVQKAYQTVADHVVANYQQAFAADFLRVADPWVIAHALASKGIVVTFETKTLGSGRVKIPNVCEELGVTSLNLYRMLKNLGVKFD